MKRLTKVLFAALLTAAAIVSTPAVSLASIACDNCAATGECFYCCRCDGGSIAYCSGICR